MTTVQTVLQILGVLALIYFVALSLIYIALTAISWWIINRYLRSRIYAAAEEAFASPLTPPVSVLLPAYNEAPGIVESVDSLLKLRYPEFEVIVINDGSSDRTLDELRKSFELRPIRKALRNTVICSDVRGAYASLREANLLVIDKANGGKADALNAGINAARYPYFCAVDADAILEEEALLRVAKPLLDDPELVAATGGIVRIANGCVVDRGRIAEVRAPHSKLATFQVVEYFRAFLVGRVAWSKLQSLLIVSGAFGLFRRETVEAVGGYWTETVGEDVELVIRLHRYLRERGEQYRIDFIPDPVCWTEAPESLRELSRQRRRWQVGLAEALGRHRRPMGNPRYGAMGVLAMPYFFVFELLGPMIELIGYLVVPIAFAAGAVSIVFLIAFYAVALVLGMALSIAALTLEEFSFRRYRRTRDAVRLLAFAFLENFGYRQLIALVRAFATIDMFRSRRTWGEMKRRGFGEAPHMPGS